MQMSYQTGSGVCTLELAKRSSEGEQKVLPQNVPLWHVDYFDLKAVKT